MDIDEKLNKEDLDMVFGGENTPPKDAPAALYNIGDRVRVYYNENNQFTGRIRDRNYYSGRWVYNVDDAAVSEKFIVGLA